MHELLNSQALIKQLEAVLTWLVPCRSPWGAGTFAGGRGERQPSEVELKKAEILVRTCLCLCYARELSFAVHVLE